MSKTVQFQPTRKQLWFSSKCIWILFCIFSSVAVPKISFLFFYLAERRLEAGQCFFFKVNILLFYVGVMLLCSIHSFSFLPISKIILFIVVWYAQCYFLYAFQKKAQQWRQLNSRNTQAICLNLVELRMKLHLFVAPLLEQYLPH